MVLMIPLLETSSQEAQDSHADKKRKEHPRCVFIVVMGVSGTGKTTLGTAIAKELKLPFIEGDDLHPRSNIEKMSNGQPLMDEDREPWLELVRRTAEQHHIAEMQIKTQSGHGDGDPCGGGVVISCSALKKYYRDILRGRLKPFSTNSSKKCSGSPEEALLLPLVEPPNPESFPTYFVFITGRKEVILKRMKDRKAHFMKGDMLQSQLDTLESPEGEDGVVTVDVEESTDSQVLKAKQGIAGEWFIQCFNNEERWL